MASYHPDKQTPANQFAGPASRAEAMPVPPAEWVEHSGLLVKKIIRDIEDGGGLISFHQYMESCLYEPGLGYYSSMTRKFGEHGDFVTAPEISPLFGHCLANYCSELFRQGCAPRILEFGAGTGSLCRSLLENQADIEQYSILELSGDLRRRQQQALHAGLSHRNFDKIDWLDGLPDQFDGLVLANEVLDAMPVHVVARQQGWVELGVTWQAGEFRWCEFSRSSAAVSQIRRIEATLGELPEGYCTEVNLNYQPWLAAIAAIAGNKACLVIDYGDESRDYYRDSRTRGSLRCYFQHRQHEDPFLYPGLQDITADVDFDAVADAAEAAGFELCGFSTQATFLLNQGLIELAGKFSETAATVERLTLAQQVKSLTLPGEMGQRFKVLLLSSGLSLNPLAYRTTGVTDG